MPDALAPYRVLDIADGGYALAGKLLADLGADVISVEPPGGSAGRSLPPFAGAGSERRSLSWAAYNVNKRGVTLDIQSDRERFVEFVRSADILLESAAPGRLDALGLGHDALLRENPALIHVSMTPFGATGPRAGWQATDLILWASSGMLYLTGEPDRAPVRVSVPMAQAIAGSNAAAGALVALQARHVTGRGQLVDVTGQVAAHWTNMAEASHGALSGTTLKRQGEFRNLGYSKLRQLFRCKDGYVVYFTMEATWGAPFNRRLAQWMVEEGAAEPEFAEMAWESWSPVSKLRRGDREGAERELARVEEPFGRFFLTKTKDELFHEALRRELLIGPVLTSEELYGWEHLAARGSWQPVQLPGLDRPIRFPAPFISLSETPIRQRRPPPEPGEHTAEVLAELEERRTAPAPGAPFTLHSSPFTLPPQALAGLKVLDFTWVIVGPLTTAFFADHGAAVLRVESLTKPDFARSFAPFKDDKPGINRSQTSAIFNTSKRSLGLHLGTERGRALVRRLIERWQPDIIAESYAPGTMARWGLDYNAVRQLRPDIIYFTTTQLGQTGPFAHFAGFGNLGGAIAGYNEFTGWPDSSPIGTHGALPDMVNPALAATALLAALDYRRRTGKGQNVDLAQVEGSLQFLAPALLDYDATGRVGTRQGNRDEGMAPHGVFPCAGDDRWVAIAVRDDADWRALCDVAGRPAWRDDTRFATFEGRKQFEDELEVLISGWTAPQDAEALAERCQAAGIPASLVEDCVDLRRDPQLAHRGFYRELVHAECGPMPYDGPHFDLSLTPARMTAAPTLGGDNEWVVRDLLGLEDDEIAELLAEGILQST